MQGSLVNILTAWYNLPFSLMFMVSVIFAIVQVIGLGGESAADGEGGPDADVDADVDADGDTDLDAGGVEVPDASGMLGLLAFLGAGKAPFAVVLSLLLSSVAVSGWALNRIVETLFAPYPSVAFAGVLLLSLLAGAIVTSRGSRLLGRARRRVKHIALQGRAPRPVLLGARAWLLPSAKIYA